MAHRRRNSARNAAPDGQVSFLPPDDAEVLHLVRQNLRLLAELRSRYRSADRGGPNGRQVRCPEDIADLLAPEMEALPQEQLRVVLLVARMAELFRDAVVANAPSVILVHNHPSGDPSASPEDVKLTKDAAQAAEILSIDLLDHVIIGDGRFVSLKEQGAM